MWWILQIIGCLGVGGIQVVNRMYGIGVTSWVVYTLISMTVTYFAFSKSFSIAPSFFGAWFVGQTAMGIIGLLVAFLIFKDVVSTTQWVGLVLSVIGGYLLIK